MLCISTLSFWISSPPSLTSLAYFFFELLDGSCCLSQNKTDIFRGFVSACCAFLLILMSFSPTRGANYPLLLMTCKSIFPPNFFKVLSLFLAMLFKSQPQPGKRDILSSFLPTILLLPSTYIAPSQIYCRSHSLDTFNYAILGSSPICHFIQIITQGLGRKSQGCQVRRRSHWKLNLGCCCLMVWNLPTPLFYMRGGGERLIFKKNMGLETLCQRLGLELGTLY